VSFETFLEETIRRIIREEIQSAVSKFSSRVMDGERRATRTEAAAAAGISPATLKAWVRAGKVREYGKGRGVRYSITEVLAVQPDKDTFSVDARVDEIFGGKRG
jgi:hypothetical protein